MLSEKLVNVRRMTEEKLETLVQAIGHWAEEEIDRLVYSGSRPVSICPTVEAATREAAIAQGNAMAHSAEINEIKSVSAYAAEWLKVALYREGLVSTR
jgi:hypothetical protein